VAEHFRELLCQTTYFGIYIPGDPTTAPHKIIYWLFEPSGLRARRQVHLSGYSSYLTSHTHGWTSKGHRQAGFSSNFDYFIILRIC
jgi:hypothetical protein